MNLGGTIRLNRTGLCVILCLAIFIIVYIQSGKKTDIQNETVSKSQKEISLRELLYSSIRAAQRGGHEIRTVKTLDIQSKGKTKEGVNDSVTNADLKSHCAMYQSLSQTFPNLQIVSEEKTVCDDKDLKIDLSNLENFSNIPDTLVPLEQITVWIDPLDATKEFTENKFQYVTTMVCVAVKGKPVIGVIYKPFTEKTSYAWVDKTKSDDLHKPAEHSIDNPTVIISLSHAGTVAQELKKSFGEDVKIIEAAGAGYKALEVASGNATIYYHITSIKKWDICAGNAIINSLGGKMTTSYNDEIDYSALGKVVNDKGLIATIYNHDNYVGKLSNQKMQ